MILNTFQFRASRYCLNLGVRDMVEILNLSRTSISTLENLPNFHPMNISDFHSRNLADFFNSNGISFKDENSMSFIGSEAGDSLTRFQLRAARVIMHITQQELSIMMDFPTGLIGYLEKLSNDYLLTKTPKIVDEDKIRSFFNSKGIEFTYNSGIYLKEDFRNYDV